MTPFEYVTVLISIVLGLGITQIVTGVAEIIHQWDRIKIYWPHLLWVVLVFFLHIQEWWWLYDLRSYDQWRLPMFLFIILYPINLFIMARILFPGITSESPLDLRVFYFDNYRKFFLLAMMLPVISILDNVFIEGRPWTDQVVQMVVFLILSLANLRPLRSERVHKAIVLVLLGIVLASFAILWNELILR